MSNNSVNEANFEKVKSIFEQINQIATTQNSNLQLGIEKINSTKDLINTTGNIFLESKRLDNENLLFKKELAVIVSDFKLKQFYLEGIFAHRSKIIDKHFEVIDKGLREGNDMLVLQGLKGASEFVSKNPLDDFDTFKNILRDKNKPLELDF